MAIDCEDWFETMQRAIQGETEILPDDFFERANAGEFDHLVNPHARRQELPVFQDDLFLHITIHADSQYVAVYETPSIEGNGFRITQSGDKLTLPQVRDITKSIEAMLYLEEFEELHEFDYLEFLDPLSEHADDIQRIRNQREDAIQKKREIEESESQDVVQGVLSQLAAAPKSECQLYRHWDKDGRLLYVGISCNFVNRLAQHRNGSAWFPLIANVTIEHFGTREECERAEVHAIRTELPIFNRQHSTLRIAA